MSEGNPNVEAACRRELESFFAVYPNASLEERALRALRFLRLSDRSLAGKAEGWAAGILYTIANTDRQACGLPGILNSEFEEIMRVSMETIRRRAAHFARLTAI